MKLEEVVPWGRSYAEYVRMFDLTPVDVAAGILDCAGGPASFNAEATRRGYRVVSCDPLHRTEDLRPHRRDVREIRMTAMRRFLEDFPQGLKEGRYRPDTLPNISLGNGEFDLALCSTCSSPTPNSSS